MQAEQQRKQTSFSSSFQKTVSKFNELTDRNKKDLERVKYLNALKEELRHQKAS